MRVAAIRAMIRAGVAGGALLTLMIATGAVTGAQPDDDLRGGAPGGVSGDAPADIPVGGRIAAENACYVRLPDMPAGRYGGFGAYNPESGVLAYAGGAEKLADDITFTHSDLFAVRLDGPQAAWQTIAYAADAGYARSTDHGCREMASVPLGGGQWASVLGKDGCDNGRFSEGSDDGGDIKTLGVGRRAHRNEVRWQPGSGIEALDDLLDEEDGQLSRPFAAYDEARKRIIFGQGTFDSGKEQGTRDEVYAASRVGSKFQVKQLRVAGAAGGPGKRYGACAAYVRQPESGVDGVLVIGGRLVGTTFADAWWLDFAHDSGGEWVDLTGRFENFDAFGARYEAACAYDPASRAFYTWMGRIDADITNGAARSAGAWRLDLARLGDPDAALRWERLAADDLDGIEGRHLVPSVWDPTERRMLVAGGRRKLDTFADVWAIYPDITGAACEALDPYARFQEGAPAPTETAIPPARPTATTIVRPTPPPGVTPGATSAPPAAPTLEPVIARACARIRGKVPPAVINEALANPFQIEGFAQRQFPSLPPGPQNPRRLSLTLRNPGLAWDALFNPVIFKASCS